MKLKEKKKCWISFYISEILCNFAPQSEVMDRLKAYKIDLHGLKEGVNAFDFKLDNDYFEAVGGELVNKGNLDAHVDIDRKSSLFEVKFNIEGVVYIPCDICLDDMEQPVALHITVNQVPRHRQAHDDHRHLAVAAHQ